MAFRFPKYTIFAKLGPDDVPILCKRDEAYKWLNGTSLACMPEHAEVWKQNREYRQAIWKQTSVKSDEIDGWTVYTAFQFYSSEPDIPMFWEVRWYRVRPYGRGDCRFGTKEAALEFHAALVSGEEPFVEAGEDDQDSADWWKE